MPGQRLRLKAERVANSVANLVATLGEQRQRANQTAALLRLSRNPENTFLTMAIRSGDKRRGAVLTPWRAR